MSSYEAKMEERGRKAYSKSAFTLALSPIREEPIETPPTEDATAQIEDEDPLPDLIIERVSPRKRHHDDESDEFYSKFTKKIKRHYKNYYLKEVDDDASSICESIVTIHKADRNYDEDVFYDKEINELSLNTSYSFVSPVNQQSVTGCKIKSLSVEIPNAPKSLLIQSRLPDNIDLNESLSDESECPIATSTPIKEYHFLETITEETTVLDQDGSKYVDDKEDAQPSNREGIEAEIHTSHEDTNDIEEDDINRNENLVHSNPEIEVKRGVQTSRQSLSIEHHSFSSNTNSSVTNFSPAMRLSFENIDDGVDVRGTSIINESFPKINAVERISTNENVKSRVGLKRSFSFPEDCTKRFKTVNLHINEAAKQYKHAFAQTHQVASIVNVGTQTDEMPKMYINTHTQVDRQVRNEQIQTEETVTNIGTQTDEMPKMYINTHTQVDRQVRNETIQTEETVTNNVEVQTDIRVAGMMDRETQTDDFFERRWHSRSNYYHLEFNFF